MIQDLSFAPPPNELLEYAKSLLGLPYVWGAQDPRYGADCSGFINIVHGRFGIGPTYDTTAQGLYRFHIVHGVGSFPEIGALVFFGKHLSAITHVGMIIEPDHFIEAGGGDAKTKTPEMARKIGAQVRISHFNRRPDLVAICMPNYSVAKVGGLA